MGNVPIYTKTGSIEGLPLATKGGDRKLDRDKLKKSCADFEAVFIQQLLKSMRQTVMRSDFIGNGAGKDIYESLFDQELSQSLSKREGLGLGKVIYNRMIQQEERRGATPPAREKTETDQPGIIIRSPHERGNLDGAFGR
jgi:flagellar protein FlgJ